MELLTDGTENNPLLGFCLAVISRHAKKWPPTEQVLADEFVDWFGANSLMTPTAMRKLCGSKKINLSFAPLSAELHGFNCSFRNKNEIVISEHEMAPFGHVHTLFHELREMLERAFVELGHSTLTPDESLELTAEEFAMAARMATVTRELPGYVETVNNIEKNWHRYFGYGLLIVLVVAYLFSCVSLPQYEDMISEARNQRGPRIA